MKIFRPNYILISKWRGTGIFPVLSFIPSV